MLSRLSLSHLLIFALALRLLWAMLIPVSTISDSGAYDTFAQNILFHGVYGWSPNEPGAYWAVGTPAIYAASYLVFGVGPLAVVFVNLISSLIVIFCLWELGVRWFGEAAGRLASLLFACWPLTIQYVTVLASELHFMALTSLGLLVWERWRIGKANSRWGYLMLAGVFFAAATYVRPIALLIPIALALAAMINARTIGISNWSAAAIVTAIIILAVSPWSDRNERVFGEPVFMSTNFGANFWMGNHPGTSGEYTPLPQVVSTMSEVERNHYLKQLSFEYVKEAPFEFIGRTVKKVFLLHQRETIGVVWNEQALTALGGLALTSSLKLASTGYWYTMLLAAIAGVLALVRQRGLIAALVFTPVWLWLYFTGVHAVIVVGDRYHMPAIPMIAVLAGFAFSTVQTRRSER